MSAIIGRLVVTSIVSASYSSGTISDVATIHDSIVPADLLHQLVSDIMPTWHFEIGGQSCWKKVLQSHTDNLLSQIWPLPRQMCIHACKKQGHKHWSCYLRILMTVQPMFWGQLKQHYDWIAYKDYWNSRCQLVGKMSRTTDTSQISLVYDLAARPHWYLWRSVRVSWPCCHLWENCIPAILVPVSMLIWRSVG